MKLKAASVLALIIIAVIAIRVGSSIHRDWAEKHAKVQPLAALAVAEPLAVNPNSVIGTWKQVGKLCQDVSLGKWIGTTQQCGSSAQDIEIALTIAGDERRDTTSQEIRFHGNEAAIAADNMLQSI